MVDSVGDVNGILLVDKPEGITSFRVVSIIRRVTGIKKVGHIGTLDPFATGLLPVCIGKATRVVPYMEHFDKTYICTARFGAFSDTQDCTGQLYGGRKATTQEVENYTSRHFEKFRQMILNLKGEHWQTPPKYSAVKINGRPAYHYARKGADIEIKPRRIIIHSARLIEVRFSDHFEVCFEISCSKGTYIRTICEKLGEMTEWGAYAQTLRRTQCGPFSIDQSYTPEQIESSFSLRFDKMLLAMDDGLRHLHAIELTKEESDRIKLGQKLDLSVFLSRIKKDKVEKYRAIYNEQLIAIVYPCYTSNPAVLRIERMMA